MRLGILLALFAGLAVPSVAPAFVLQEKGGLESAANGIVLGPDGNLWAAESGAGKVVRMTPDGTVVGRLTVGASPTSLAAGPGGRVWVSVTGADKLVWIDAMSASPTAHDVPLPLPAGSDCGPVAVVAPGNGRVYFSMPNPGDGSCTTDSRVGYIKDDGTGAVTAFNKFGRVFDMDARAGQLFLPDFAGEVIRRAALDDDLTITSEVTVPGGGGLPDGVVVDGAGTVWTTLYGAGAVSRHPASQVGGSALMVTPGPAGSITNPFGIVAGSDGRIYVTGQTSGHLWRIDPATNASVLYPVGGQPWQIVNGPDSDLWFSDLAGRRLLRFVNGAPRATTGAAEALASTAAMLKAQVDTRGNDTAVVFEYGTTTAYGSTTPPVGLAAGVGPNDVQSALSGLLPSTTYHVRVRASNAEGSATGSDTTFTTAARLPVKLEANARFTWAFSRGRLVLTRVRIESLTGGETATVTCKGRGCPFKRKTYRNLKRGTKSLTRIFGRKRRLRAGIKIEISVAKPPDIGRVATLTVRKGNRAPKIVRRCLPAGATRPTRC